MPKAPSPCLGVTLPGMTSCVISKTVTSSSSLLWAYAPIPVPPAAYGFPRQSVFAGCCQPLLAPGSSRRYLCGSVLMRLDLYPGCSCGALTRFFPLDFGLPPVGMGSALCISPCGDFSTDSSFGIVVISSVQTHKFARHPGRSHRTSFQMLAAMTSTPEHLTPRYLGVPRVCYPSESGN